MKNTLSWVLLFVLLFFVGSIAAQSKTHPLNGKVISFEESFPLEGVSVKIKGTQYITGTQSDGTFTLDIADEKQVLVFELTDYETQEIVAGTKNNLEVALRRKNSTALNVTKHIYTIAAVPEGNGISRK